MNDYQTKHGDEREQYSSGMQRDAEKGKPRFDLIIPLEVPYDDQLLTRIAKLYQRGAEHYEDRNWERGAGQEELDRARSSAFRHFMQWFTGEKDEDHAAAVFFNIQAAEYFERRMGQRTDLQQVATARQFVADDLEHYEAENGPVRGESDVLEWATQFLDAWGPLPTPIELTERQGRTGERLRRMRAAVPEVAAEVGLTDEPAILQSLPVGQPATPGIPIAVVEPGGSVLLLKPDDELPDWVTRSTLIPDDFQAAEKARGRHAKAVQESLDRD
jgi:hypothetical protein